MYPLPQDPKKIRSRLRRYERELRREQQTFGAISDGSGKRYLLGPLYLLLDDLQGALASFAWFEQTFPDDVGEPAQYLCWTLALYRAGDLDAAARKLRQTMLSNLYLVPHLLGAEQAELDIWHGSNWAEKDYLNYVPDEFLALWDKDARQWLAETYHSPPFRQVRERYIAIWTQLKNEPVGPKRSRLVQEASRLRDDT